MLLPIERILCPVDLTPGSEAGLIRALALAHAYDAKLFVCHCVRDTDAADAAASVMPLIHDIFGRAAARLVNILDPSTLSWEAVVARGVDFGQALAREALERHVDLIVMRSRRRPRRAALLGSTAESISRTAPCPVLITHSDELQLRSDGAAEGLDFKRVLVAYDFSQEAGLALRFALSFAQEYQSELHLLHVLPDPEPDEPELAWVTSGAEGTYQSAARALQRAVPGEAYLWCQVRQAVRCGKASREILGYAAAHQIDLICMGANGLEMGRRTGNLFGSHVERVLRQAPCPVLIARPPLTKGPSAVAYARERAGG